MSNDHENLSTHSTDHDLTTKPSILTNDHDPVLITDLGFED